MTRKIFLKCLLFTLLLSVAAVVEFAAARADGTSVTVGAWSPTASFHGPRTTFGSVLVHNKVYIFGGLYSQGNDFDYYNDVQFATLGNTGEIVAPGWQATTPFHGPRSGLAAATHDSYVYIVGGYGAPGVLGDTQYAAVLDDGSLGSWTVSPYILNFPRSNHRLEVATTPQGDNYLLAIAGVRTYEDGETVHYDYVEAAAIKADGSIGPWQTCSYHLKGGRSAPATLVQGGRLYVFGGWGDLLTRDVFSDIQYAAIQNNGCVGFWYTNPFPLPARSYGHTVVAINATQPPTAILLGGNIGQGNYLNSVFSTQIAADGSLTFVGTQSSLFSIPRWGHESMIYGRFIYVMGGSTRLTAGTLNDVQYAEVEVLPVKE